MLYFLYTYMCKVWTIISEPHIILTHDHTNTVVTHTRLGIVKVMRNNANNNTIVQGHRHNYKNNFLCMRMYAHHKTTDYSPQCPNYTAQQCTYCAVLCHVDF